MVDDPGEQVTSKSHETEPELTVDLDKPRKRGLSKLHTGQLFQAVLQDAQTRLFFKAQSVIQSEIRNFTPKADDLAYPDRIVGTNDALFCRTFA